MTAARACAAILSVIQRDLAGRGLAQAGASLFDYCPDDLRLAAVRLSQHPAAVLGVVTGFWVATAGRFETDGPPGAVFLARALGQMGIQVRLFTDAQAVPLLQAGLQRAGCSGDLVRAVTPAVPPELNFLLAIERVGPGHTTDSLQAQVGNSPDALAAFAREVPTDEQGRCRSMRGIDITEQTASFENWLTAPQVLATIAIGDGGNEIGMGKVPWSMIRQAVPGGGRTACRLATDFLIVAGVSNWGAYALAAMVAVVRGCSLPGLFDAQREKAVLAAMVEVGLIDGVSGRQSVSVDGLDWPVHAEVLHRLGQIVESKP